MPTSSDGVLTVTADATTGSVLIKFDFTGLGVPQPTTNLVRNPNSDAAVALLALSNSTVVRVTTPVRSGAGSTRVTATTAATASATGINPTSQVPVVAGEKYTVSAYFRPATTARTVQVQIIWYTAAGGFISGSTAGSVLEVAGTWTRCSMAGVVAPGAAAYATVSVLILAPGAGEIHYVDDIQLERGATLTAYCDGNQLGAGWNGAVNNSISVRPPFDRVTVYRSSAGGDPVVVRGIDAAQHPGGVGAGIDHEAPLGVSTSYTAALGTRNGTVLASTAVVVASPSPARSGWLKSLTQPAKSVLFTARTLPDWEDGVDQGVLRVIGREDPIVVSDVRQYGKGALSILVLSAAEEAALRALLRDTGTLLLQSATAFNEPDIYVSVGTLGRARVVRIGADTFRQFDLPLTVVARPSTGGALVAVPGHTFGDSKARWPLFSNRTGTFLDRLTT